MEVTSKYGSKPVILHPNGRLEGNLTRKIIATRKAAGELRAGAIAFDSIKEAEYYRDVLLPQIGKTIAEIEIQPKYTLIPAFETPYGKKHRAHTYSPDFLVKYADGKAQAIDVKGFPNDRFPINRKLFEYQNRQTELTVIYFRPAYGGWITDETYKKEFANRKKTQGVR